MGGLRATTLDRLCHLVSGGGLGGAEGNYPRQALSPGEWGAGEYKGAQTRTRRSRNVLYPISILLSVNGRFDIWKKMRKRTFKCHHVLSGRILIS